MLGLLVLLNALVALFIVFREVRDVSSTWAWLLVLMFLPGIGLVLYLFFGKKISKENIFGLQNQDRLGLLYSAHEQRLLLQDGVLGDVANDRDKREMIELFLHTEESVYTENNDVQLFFNGKSKFDSLLADIKHAKHHVHLQYYIFNNDTLGTQIMELLKEKAKQGVEVLVLYDAWGSRTLRPSFFRRLTHSGGKAAPFFGSTIPFINLRLNYRNHRKIVVIDGNIGYVGGYNIGDEYLGKSDLGYWRDSHLRIEGEAVHTLQTRFLVDWNAAVSEKDQVGYKNDYFPKKQRLGDYTPMQIVSDGPDTDWEYIKLGYLKMISLARESIYLQTPYFIPDESMLDALRIAIRSGVAVHIMIPNKPDHPFVYRATEYYAKLCQELGAHIYVYDKGFLHAKVLVVDDRFASVGTANFDIRSFRLNFEVSAFVYDAVIAKTLTQQFLNDIQDSTYADHDYFARQSAWKKTKQLLSRLLSPIL